MIYLILIAAVAVALGAFLRRLDQAARAREELQRRNRRP